MFWKESLAGEKLMQVEVIERSLKWCSKLFCEYENGCFKKTKHVNFFEKRIFVTPWYAHVRVRTRG